MLEILKKEPVKRALRTFFQVFCGVIAAGICENSGIVDSEEIKRIVVLGVATALAAVMNLKKEE